LSTRLMISSFISILRLSLLKDYNTSSISKVASVRGYYIEAQKKDKKRRSAFCPFYAAMGPYKCVSRRRVKKGRLRRDDYDARVCYRGVSGFVGPRDLPFALSTPR